jgi:hypothetical protein
VKKQTSFAQQLRILDKALGIADDESWEVPKQYPTRSKVVARRVRKKMEKAYPHLREEVLSAFSVDLADLWEIGRKHEYYLKQFLQLRFPKDRYRLESLLITWIEIQLLVHARWHLDSLKAIMPKVLREAALSGEEQSPGTGRHSRKPGTRLKP